MRRTGQRASLAGEQGTVYAEYTVVLVLVALVMSVALAALGVPFVDYYRSVQRTVYSPLP